jgi:hypothetical protein
VTGFDEAWACADAVPGWLTRAQGRALWDAARTVQDGSLILEIGSHQGRSTIVLANAARSVGASVVAVDPFLAGGVFGGVATRGRFEANIEAAGVADVVRLVAEKSTALRPRWHDPIDMLFIDGKHDYWTVRDDLKWAAYLPAEAPVLIHDSFSSIGVTLGLLMHALPSSKIRYVGRDGSLAHFVVGPPSAGDRWRMLCQLPWFIRNVAVKLALRAARLVGYHRTPDPY